MKDQAEKLRLYYIGNDHNCRQYKKIFSFTSGKGGTGKTFLALNSAYALARLQKRVLVIDLDFNLANLHLLLNVNPLSTLNEFFLGKKTLFDTITNLNNNIDAIFGEPGSSNMPHLSDSQLNILFSNIRKISGNYDYILIDTGAGANSTIINLLKRCDENIFVVTPEPTSVMDAYVLMKFLYQNSGKNLFPVIINKCNDEHDGVQAFEKLQTAVTHFLNIELINLGSVNYSEEIRSSLIEQKLFINSYILSPEAEQILELAGRINEYLQMANNNHTINQTQA